MKVCNICGIELTEDNTTEGTRKHKVNRCRDCVNSESKKIRSRPIPEDKTFYCTQCGIELTDETWAKGDKKHRQRICRLCKGERNYMHLKRVQTDVLNHYGGKCAYCGSTKDLQIDHMDGKGKKHREEIGNSSQIYYWLQAHGYPEGFQVLCRTHNISKSNMNDQEYRQLIKDTYHLFFS